MVNTHGSIALILECLIKHPIGQQQIEVYGPYYSLRKSFPISVNVCICAILILLTCNVFNLTLMSTACLAPLAPRVISGNQYYLLQLVTRQEVQINIVVVVVVVKWSSEKKPLNYFLSGRLTVQSFNKLNIKKILGYMDFLKNNSPRHRFRFSQQAWLLQDKTADPVLRRLHERLILLNTVK